MLTAESGYGSQAVCYLSLFHFLVLCSFKPAANQTNPHSLNGGRTRRESSKWSQAMTKVCQRGKHAHAMKGGEVSLARCKVCECSSHRTKQLGGGLERVGCSQDTLPNLPCPARLSACLLYSLIYSQRSINLPTMWLHPHPSLIQFALICRELHLSLREGGGGLVEVEEEDGVGEPAQIVSL